MKKYISTIGLLSFFFVTYHSVWYYDGLLHLVDRWDAGTIQEDIVDHQTNHDTGMVNIVAKDHNLTAVERVVNCVKSDGIACK
jgi:hypothetical protein